MDDIKDVNKLKGNDDKKEVFESFDFGINENFIKLINDEKITPLISLDDRYKYITEMIKEIKLSKISNLNISLYIYIHFIIKDIFTKKDELKSITGKDILKFICENEKKFIIPFDYIDIIKYITEKKIEIVSSQNSSSIKISINNTNNITLDDMVSNSTESSLSLNYKLISTCMKSKGKLDLLLKSLIVYLLIKNEKLKNLSLELIDLISKPKFPIFNEKIYMEYVDKFTMTDDSINYIDILKKEIQPMIDYFITIRDNYSIQFIEKLLIQLVGSVNKEISIEAVILLNCLYDGDLLQINFPFKPIVIYSNEEKEIKFNIKLEENYDYFLYIIAPSQGINSEMKYSYIYIENNSQLQFNLGKYTKSGFYDYILIKFSKETFIYEKINETIGRFIVQHNEVKSMNFHSLYVDLINSRYELQSNKILHRGTFNDLILELQKLNNSGINSLYILGALERDNYVNDSTSPFAIVNRSKISQLLGGEEQFKKVMEKASELKMNIIVDLLTRISSSRYHKKYKDLELKYIDNSGKIQILYGCEGDSINYDDNMMMNYRDIKAWNLLIDDTLELISKYNINGVHLDNAQSWPNIYNVDHDEMLREDVDEDYTRRYSNYEILNGIIVQPNEECGYWTDFKFRSAQQFYPNPLLIKLTRSIWEKYPDFIFIGECNDNSERYLGRQYALANSGVIPHLYVLPKIICKAYNKTFEKDIFKGFAKYLKSETNITKMFKHFYEYCEKHMPLNCITMLSSGGDMWPYPALLFGKGNWPYITALFTLYGIPMTFMNESKGELNRFKMCSVFECQNNNLNDNVTEVDIQNNLQNKKGKSKSFMNIKVKAIKNQNLTSSNSSTDLRKFSKAEIDINLTVDSVMKDIGTELLNIPYHYEKMRKMRNTHNSLKFGKIYFINNGGNEKVLSFCRVDKENNEIAVININFGNTTETIGIDLSVIKDEYQNMDINTICQIEDWENPNPSTNKNYYFLSEVLSQYNPHFISILPYSSNIFGFSIVIPFNPELYQKVFINSLSELCKCMKSNKYENLDSFQISSQLDYLLKNKLPLSEFTKWFNEIQTILTKNNLKYDDYFNNLKCISTNTNNSTEYFKYIHKINLLPQSSFSKYPKVPLYTDVIAKSNKYGVICFVTPELGRWSTVGGLGVMVDELTTCLSRLGQDIYIVTPYYHRNRKGQVDYLLDDVCGFIQINDFEVKIDKSYKFEVYFGKVNGVKLYFIHNEEVFPAPYADGDFQFTLREIVLMGKASLELLCNIRVIPALIVTNDWFTGLTPGYGKGGHFGEAFNYTTFFHICHNLEEAYEGRIYLPMFCNDTFNYIHQLDNNWIIDPSWQKKVINPSRCALLKSDQWGTVSKSYMADLLNHSPLNGIMKMHKHPFGYPNGIFKQNRIEKIKEMIQKVLSEENIKKDIKEIDIFDNELRSKCKEKIQKKYFKLPKLDDKIPLFSFVGRLTQQKGVLLILETAEKIIKNFNVQIIIGGMANMKDPYCVKCVEIINNLLYKYPKNFWASPNEFFTDGTLINYGSDFGLMPSSFEPGGIVQHEFFIGGTPVLAFKTGGLKDSVFEYDYDKHSGNGVIFEKYDKEQLYESEVRAVKIYQSKKDFELCRKNAFNSAIDVMDVAKAWGKEFYRLKGKTFCDYNAIDKCVLEFNKDLDKQTEIFNNEIKDYDVNTYIFNSKELKPHVSDDVDLIPVTFIYLPEIGKKISSVQISGDWNNWEEKTKLIYDPLNFRWRVKLSLKRGKYLYKYIINGDEWIVNENEKVVKQGNITNNEVNV